MNETDDERDPGRSAAGIPPFPDRPPAVGPIYSAPSEPSAPSAHYSYPYYPHPPQRRPARRRSAGFRLIITAGFVAAAILTGGVGTLVFQEIQDFVAGDAPALPAAGDTPLTESLERSHDGVQVDWSAGPVLDDEGLDRGIEVTDAPGVLMVDTRFMQGMGTATGVVLSAEGLAVTNYHVVEDASEVTVTVADSGDVYSAKVLGRDSLHDIAVLQIEDAPALQTASIDTEKPQRGERSAAVGNGGGQGYLTAVTGEVTGLDEAIVASSEVPDDYSRLSGLIETSADVVPGYSGGPLVDGNGQVIGITTAASKGDSAEQVSGYAVPVSTALDVVEQVLSGEETETVSIGVDGALGIVVGTERDRAVVIEVTPGSSADQLGLQAGDVIHSVDGHPVRSGAELSEIVNDHNVGDVISVDWTTQDGEERSAEATLQEAVVY
ncbi:S1C family serine protease [Citricoccus sp. GCM10030269]|uniref:S1C family serine protease n=1 Tax=Citricoccus sp. GCM10030269 TaxID=3273388 RepID=UPI0036169DFA